MGYRWTGKVSIFCNLYCSITYPIRFRSLVSMYYRKATAAIIVYDITSSKSFKEAKDWVEGELIID